MDSREVWQRGPVEGVPPLLQPAAHALLQAAEDARKFTADLSAAQLWERPAGVASVGFHLMHIRGVVDRLFTYARGAALTPEQLKEVAAEKEVPAETVSPAELVDRIDEQVQKALAQLRDTNEDELTQTRLLGRKQIPTTTLGLIFHAAEHAQRHIGQLLVTARVVGH